MATGASIPEDSAKAMKQEATPVLSVEDRAVYRIMMQLQIEERQRLEEDLATLNSRLVNTNRRINEYCYALHADTKSQIRLLILRIYLMNGRMYEKPLERIPTELQRGG